MSWMDRFTPAVVEGGLAALEGSEDVELVAELDARLEGPAATKQMIQSIQTDIGCEHKRTMLNDSNLTFWT